MRLRKRFLSCCFAMLLAGMFGISTAAAPQQPSPQSNTQPAEAAGAPVVAGGKTLFTVQERLFTFSPEDRAKTIAGRVLWLSNRLLKN